MENVKLKVVQSQDDFMSVVNDDYSRLIVAHFSAPWAPQCNQVNDVLTELMKKGEFTNVIFLQLEAESFPELSQKYDVTAVPTCVLIKSKAEVDKVQGANIPELTKKIEFHALPQNTKPPSDQPKIDLNARLKMLIESAPVMLFMKGSPENPKCKFSRAIIEIMSEHNAVYSTFDILTDEAVRQGLKTYSNFPTFPQLYINGELIGGIDIVKEMVKSGEFKKELPSLENRLKALISQRKVMLFMKGSPTEPKCGFSRTVVSILNEIGVDYGHFDILTDEAVRQGLKTYSDWATYPQLYVNDELIGGVDIIKELQQSGELESTLQG